MTIEILVGLGLLTHFLSNMAAASDAQGKPVNPIRRLKDKPYSTSLSVVGAVAGYLFMGPELNAMVDSGFSDVAYISAFGMGYAADSIIDKAANIAKERMNNKASGD